MGFNEPSTNANWINDQSYQYEVWTDDNRDLASYYGADSLLAPLRVTLILDAEGTLLLEYREDTGASGHPQTVLEDCELLFGTNP